MIKVGETIALAVVGVLAQFANTKFYAMAAGIITVGADIIMQFVGLSYFVDKKDAGALLGCAMFSFMSLVSNYIGFATSFALSGILEMGVDIVKSGSQVVEIALNLVPKGLKWMGALFSLMHATYLLMATICNPLKAVFTIPALVSIIGTYIFAGHRKLFMGIAIISSLLGFLVPLIMNLVLEDDDPFSATQIPEITEFLSAPMSSLAFLMSSLGLGAVMGILRSIDAIGVSRSSGSADSGKSPKNFFMSLMTVYSGMTVFSALTYLMSFMVMTQLPQALLVIFSGIEFLVPKYSVLFN